MSTIELEDIPEFLRRPPPTEQERRRLRRHIVNDRKIKNPPSRISKQARLLGAAFNTKIVRT